jgi:hypothetical protein
VEEESKAHEDLEGYGIGYGVVDRCKREMKNPNEIWLGKGLNY